MLHRFQLVRNVGQFDSATWPARADLKRLSLIYAENGRGKTTLSAILRSLASGDPIHVTERHRLGAQHPPEIVILDSTAPAPARFTGAAWTRTCPNVVVFDDAFIDRNVYSGL